MNKLRVGLTGSIGSGKTTVAKMLAAHGAAVVDVDLAGRWVLEHDEKVRQEIRKAFGAGVFLDDGTIDRPKLGALVFADLQKLETLNRIVHPPMLEKVLKEIKTFENDDRHPYIIVDAALIFELNLDKMLDLVVTVSAPLEVSLQRTHLRDRLSVHQIKQRIQSQIPIDEKIKRSDFVIENDGSLQDLAQKVAKLHIWLLMKSKQKALHDRFANKTGP